MPIYEFKCLACNSEFEELCRVGKGAKCPHCTSTNTQKNSQSFLPKVPAVKALKVLDPDTHAVLAMAGVVGHAIKESWFSYLP